MKKIKEYLESGKNSLESRSSTSNPLKCITFIFQNVFGKNFTKLKTIKNVLEWKLTENLQFSVPLLWKLFKPNSGGSRLGDPGSDLTVDPDSF